VEKIYLPKSYFPKGNQEHDWLIVDVNQGNLGRTATQIAAFLLGKHKPSFTPGVDLGDYVIVLNAQALTIAPKRLDQKVYYKHSGYPGGLKSVGMREQMRVHPERVIRAAVWGMLPHNRLGRKLIKRLKIYAGNEHEHEAQMPKLVA